MEPLRNATSLQLMELPEISQNQILQFSVNNDFKISCFVN